MWKKKKEEKEGRPPTCGSVGDSLSELVLSRKKERRREKRGEKQRSSSPLRTYLNYLHEEKRKGRKGREEKGGGGEVRTQETIRPTSLLHLEPLIIPWEKKKRGERGKGKNPEDDAQFEGALSS